MQMIEMRPEWNDPDYWTLRAEELTAIAEGTHDPISRCMLNMIAADYERLAHQAAARAEVLARLTLHHITVRTLRAKP